MTVAGEPIANDDDDYSEASVSKVEITYWNAIREQGRPPGIDSPYGAGGIDEEKGRLARSLDSG